MASQKCPGFFLCQTVRPNNLRIEFLTQKAFQKCLFFLIPISLTIWKIQLCAQKHLNVYISSGPQNRLSRPPKESASHHWLKPENSENPKNRPMGLVYSGINYRYSVEACERLGVMFRNEFLTNFGREFGDFLSNFTNLDFDASYRPGNFWDYCSHPGDVFERLGDACRS